MSKDDVSRSLLDFGFAAEEAEIYLFLLTNGPCPASVVSRRMGVDRVKAYRTLNLLANKGLVQTALGRPIRFTANPLKEVLEGYLSGAKTKVSELEKRKEEILEYWKGKNVEQSSDHEPRFRILQGRQKVYDQLTRACEKAQKEICLLTTRNDLYRLEFAGFVETLNNLRKEGIVTRIITELDQRGIKAAESYLKVSEVRHAPLATTIRLAVVDESEAVPTFAMDDSMSMTTSEDVGLWTNAPNYVRTMRAFFDAVWSTATDARHVTESLKSGKTPQSIRMIGTWEGFLETYESMLKGTGKELKIMTKDLRSLPLTKTLKNVSERGVEVKVLTEASADDLAELEEVSELAQTRHSPSAGSLQLIVADEREVLIHVPYMEAMGNAFWSNLKAYVDTMIRVFEDRWTNGVTIQDLFVQLVNEKSLREALELAKESLEKIGFVVDAPGELVGRSGLKHHFDLVATPLSKPNEAIVIDIATETSILSHMISLTTKMIDAKPLISFLAGSRDFSNEERRLAEIYNLNLLHGPVPLLFASQIVAVVKKAAAFVER